MSSSEDEEIPKRLHKWHSEKAELSEPAASKKIEEETPNQAACSEKKSSKWADEKKATDVPAQKKNNTDWKHFEASAKFVHNRNNANYSGKQKPSSVRKRTTTRDENLQAKRSYCASKNEKNSEFSSMRTRRSTHEELDSLYSVSDQKRSMTPTDFVSHKYSGNIAKKIEPSTNPSVATTANGTTIGVGLDISADPTLSMSTETQLFECSDDMSTTQNCLSDVDDKVACSANTEKLGTLSSIGVESVVSDSSSLYKARKEINISRLNISNSWKQMGMLYSSLGAAMAEKNAQKHEILRLQLENKEFKRKAEESTRLAESKINSLESRIRAMKEVISSLRDEKKELEKKYKKSIKEESVFSVPIQDLRKCRRQERINLLAPLVNRIRGFQNSEESLKKANELIIDELAFCLDVDLAPFKLTPYEDYCVFIKNGITYGQRAAIKKALIVLGCDIMAPSHAVFSWKKEIEAEFENLYTVTEIEKNNVKIPLVYVNDLKTLLKKKIDLLASKGMISLDGNYGGHVWLGYVIDKGADYTKLIGHIANTPHPGSLTNSLILGIYRGNEDNDTLRECFSDISSQINVLDLVEVDSKEVKISKFFTGDIKTMTAIAGLQSCSSLFFCLFCLFSRRNCSSEVWSYDQCGSARSFASLLECVERYKDLLNKNVKNAAQICFSVTHSPLFNFPLENYIPSSLHIFLGIGNLLICILEFEVMIYDLKLLGFDTTGLNVQKDIEKLVITLETDQKKLISLQKENLVEMKVLVTLNKMILTVANPQEKKKNKKVSDQQRCQNERCYHQDSENYGEKFPNSEILTCFVCQKWFHSLCQFYVSKNYVNVVKKRGFTCNQCQAPVKSTADIVQQKIDDLNAENLIVKGKLNDIQNKMDVIEKVITKKSGETYLKLQTTLESCGAYKSAWFVTYNGNHLRKLFRPNSLSEIFCVVGLRSTPRLQKLELLMSNLQQIQDYSCARFLRDDEVVEMKLCVQKFIFQKKIFVRAVWQEYGCV